jgi:hypothetical protein
MVTREEERDMKLKEIRQSQKEFSTGRTFLLLEIAAQVAEMNERQARKETVGMAGTDKEQRRCAMADLDTEQERAEVERCWSDWGVRQVANVDYWQGWCCNKHTAAGTEADLIHDLWLYTEERKKQIARATYALSLLRLILKQGNNLMADYGQDQEALGEVIAREQARLDGLLKGWKG